MTELRLACAVAALLLASACHLIEQSDEDPPADQQASIDPADYAEQVDAKLRRFSACRTLVSSVIHESWERYTDQVGDDGKPRHKRDGVFVRGLGDNGFRSCDRVLEAAKTAPRMTTIEDALQANVDAAKRYAGLTRELEAYLDTRTSRTDDWTELTELHERMVTAHADWRASDRALQLAIDLRHAENDPVLLGVLEVRRSELEVASRKVMMRARPMVRCMTDVQAADAEAPDCEPLYDAFVDARREFSRVYANSREAADKVFWMTTFANDVEEFEAAAARVHTTLVRRSGPGRRAELEPSELQALSDGYASLVRDAETLDFDFP